MTSAPVHAAAKTDARGPGRLDGELALIRERFNDIEAIDRRTMELVAGLAGTIRNGADMRARASLEISGALHRIEALLTGDHDRQRATLSDLRDQIIAAQSRAAGLADAVSSLDAVFAGVWSRLAVSDAGEVQAGGRLGGQTPAMIETTEPPAPESSMEDTSAAIDSMFIEIDRVPSASVAVALQRRFAGIDGVVTAIARDFTSGALLFEIYIDGTEAVARIIASTREGLALTHQSERVLRFEFLDQSGAPI